MIFKMCFSKLNEESGELRMRQNIEQVSPGSPFGAL